MIKPSGKPGPSIFLAKQPKRTPVLTTPVAKGPQSRAPLQALGGQLRCRLPRGRGGVSFAQGRGAGLSSAFGVSKRTIERRCFSSYRFPTPSEALVCPTSSPQKDAVQLPRASSRLSRMLPVGQFASSRARMRPLCFSDAAELPWDCQPCSFSFWNNSLAFFIPVYCWIVRR